MGQRGLFFFGSIVLTILLQMVSSSLGAGGVLLALLVPFPAAYVHMRFGAQLGGGIVAAATVLLAATGDPATALGYFLQFGLASFLLPLLLRRFWPWDRAVIVTTLSLVVLAAMALGFYAGSKGISVRQIAADYVQKEVDQALQVYQQSDVSPQQTAELEQVLRSLGDFLLQAYPALAITVTWGILLLLVYLLSRFSRGGYAISGPPFHLWKASPLLVWILIGGGFGVVLFDGLIDVVSLNLLAVVLPIYFLQGLAIVSYFFIRKNISTGFRVMGYLLIFFLNPLPMVVTGFGIFDLWADFRKPKIKET
ncbi:MAG: DUF2232 domain-containing protein [Desulfuromonadales bacterium]|nr:DUF2232 domain-containing protein [Desulfuromonadales bacterium]MDW7757304.1 DUF2232 domain-containing protein [Desulfuromonadales bacterium]